MSDKIKLPEQLMLPFSKEHQPLPSAQVFFMQEHKLRIVSDRENNTLIPKLKEKKILDRVLERAERLSWYK